ncbi:MAG: hypothetical protein L0211_04015 [Planctomycetaceae bacterium]|nr:hypothetical protein [Planctomycetaceae bacterium]
MSSPRPRLASRRRCLLVLAFVLAALCCSLAARIALAEQPQVCQEFRVRPQDEIWAVNTRCLGCPSGDEIEPQWTVWKFDWPAPQWSTASSSEFYDTDSARIVTAMYVHGNQVDSSLALRDGLDAYFQLAGRYDDAQPVRFVIWSWPSDKIHGPLRDVRSKADRADTDAYYLARFLAPIKPEVRVGLVGYSFGARIIAGSLHLLGGGELCGVRVAAVERPIRVALWAAAEHDDWLLPGRYHGQALPVAEHWLITRNYCDPVLARYAWIEKCYDPAALGYSGLVGRNLLTPEQNALIEEIDVTHLVGKTHDDDAYLYSEPIVSRTREVVLWRGEGELGASAGERGASVVGERGALSSQD